MFCRKCGKEIQGGKKFCTACGTAVPDEMLVTGTVAPPHGTAPYPAIHAAPAGPAAASPPVSSFIPPPPPVGASAAAYNRSLPNPFTAAMWKKAFIVGLITFIVVGGISILIIALA